jgi:DNA-directed RNA polymerase specialized sigma24 family protein
MEIAAQIARVVMEAAMRELPADAPPIAVSAFCQRRARDLAVERVARERKQQCDGHLWHDAEWHPDEPLLDLHQLQTHDHAGWLAAVPVLRKLALPVIRGCGVPGEDVEDVLAETLAALTQPDAHAQPPLDALLVAEQLPALCKVIARRRAADFLRRRSAEKRDVYLEVAFDLAEDGGVATAMAATVPEFDLYDILEQSAHAVSPAQWQLITRLIIHQSDTHSSLIADAPLMSALAIDPRSSEATRRRRLHEALDLALQQIRRHLDLP